MDAERALDISAANYAAVDSVAEGENTLGARVRVLLENADERDQDTWNNAGAYIDLELPQLMKTSPERRTDEWRKVLEGLYAASVAQAQDEIIMLKMIDTIHSCAEKKQRLPKQAAIEASQIGISKDRLDRAKNGESKTTQ